MEHERSESHGSTEDIGYQVELEVITFADKKVVGSVIMESESEKEDNGNGWHNTEENEKSFAARGRGIITANTELVESTIIESKRDNNNGLPDTMDNEVEEDFETRTGCDVIANMELVDSVMIESESDDNESHDLDLRLDTTISERTSKEGPHQPILKSYDRKMYQNKSRDFNPQYFKKYPWTSFNPSSKCIECYACQTYSDDSSFKYSNWKKSEKVKKHNQSKSHAFAMTKWLSHKINQKRNTSILIQIDSSNQLTIKQNRDYLQVIIETLAFTTQQNIARRKVDENRQDLWKP